MEESSLGARLKEERKRLGLSQDDAGLKAGVSREMWGKYERDAAAPGGETFVQIAMLGFDVNYVLIGQRHAVPQPSISKGGRALLDFYDSLDVDVRDAFDGLVRVVSGKPLKSRGGASRNVSQQFHGDVGQVLKVTDNQGHIRTGDVNFGSQKKR